MYIYVCVCVRVRVRARACVHLSQIKQLSHC